MRASASVLLVVLLVFSTSPSEAAQPETNVGETEFGDFSWMHGANFTPSYAATNVEFWLDYDPEVIDRELGFAEKIGLNCVRVFLQSLVYEHAPGKFLENFADFVKRADRRGLKVMPILFDSCFGVSPSLESQHMWVANPGPDRMSKEHFEALDAYVRAVVTPYVSDERIALWDVMNEPTVTVLSLTEEGKAQVWAFVRHFGQLVKDLDTTHAITVGVAETDNAPIVDLVDVLSCHSYAPTESELRKALAVTQKQANEAGKPWIISECCAPGWGSRYEMVMPILRAFGVGHTVWEVVIGKNQFAPISGLFYPDGSVRRLSSIEAVAGRSVAGLVVKPDKEGVPIARQRAGRLAEYARFMTRDDVTESTWRERNTAVAAFILHGVYNPDAADTLKKLEDARTAYDEGDREAAFHAVKELLILAAEILNNLDEAAAEKNTQSQTIELLNLGPWTNPFSEHPLFHAVVEKWKVSAKEHDKKQRLTLETVLKRSTDHPLTLGADWWGTVPSDEIHLEAQNLGKNEVKVGVILVTTDERRITSPFHAVPPGKPRNLTFDMLDAEPQQESGQPLDLARIEVAVRSMRARIPYRMSFGSLEFRKKPGLKPVAIEPVEVTGSAGSEIRLEWAPIEGNALPETMPVSVSVEKNGRVFLKGSSRLVAAGEKVRLEPVSIRLPEGMPGGMYDVIADTRDLPVVGQPARRAEVGRIDVVEAPTGRPIVARVGHHNGAAAITLDGRPTNGLMYMTYALEERYLRPFADAGVEVFSFDTCCGFHPYGLTATSWPEPETLDFSECDAHATRILSACPDAKLLIRCYIACPPWWAEAHPDECMVAMTENKLVDYEEKPGYRPGSWASKRWRADMGQVLRRFVQHLRNSSYSDRIISLMVCAGVTEEWMMFGSNSGGVLTDYSKPAKNAFRTWSRRRYETEEHLRESWRDPHVSFDTAEPPTPHDIAMSYKGDFLDISRGERVPDWWRFLSDLTADTIEHYCGIVKEESRGDWMCGVFYGYVLQFHEPRILTAGHLAIDRLNRSPHLDYFFSPALYSHRSLKPGGYSAFMSLPESCHLNGGLWCNENDLRTFRVMDVPNVKADQIDRRQTPEETTALLRRQLGAVLARGCGHSYFDMGGGWYDDPRLAEEVRAQVAVTDRVLQMDRSSATEVAVVIEPDAFTYQSFFTKVNTWLILGQVATLGNMGTPFDLVTLRDMELLPRRKLWIFPNLFNASPSQIDAIHARLREDEAMGLFVYAPGYISGQDAMRRLTGMRIVADERRRPVNALVSRDGPLVDADVVYGTSSPVGPASFGAGEISPTFHVDDDQAEVLGLDTSSNLPALCRKEMAGWNSVYSAAPCIAPAVLRALAKRAGVHLYVDEDAVVYANQSLLSITVVEPGRRTIRLPRRATIEDGFTGEVLASDAEQVAVEFAERESKLLLLTQ
jgi:hypothetical protein